MLQYPSGSGMRGSDFVTFSPMPYKSNSQGGPGGFGSSGVAGPAAASAQAITLYMPNSTPSVGNDNMWEKQSFDGPLGAIMRDVGAAVVGGVSDASLDSDPNSMMERVKADFNAPGKNLGGAAKQGLLQAIEGMLPGTANQMLALSRGQVFNPNVEMLYNQPGMRAFSFSFDFIPKNASEAAEVDRIILNFKKWSAPKDLENGMFEVPYVWQVVYNTSGGRNTHMNAFKKAALTNVAVQANASTNMHVSHIDGAPIQTSINLSFKEVNIITRGDHEQIGGQGY
jgi:hypothetical protein